MALYPKGPGDRSVDPAVLEGIVAAVFARCGMSGEDAGLLAASLVAADRRGILSHGVLRVPDYVKKLTVDGVDPRGRPAIVSDRGAAIVVDGHNAMGQIAGTFAMRRAIGRAREIGLGLAAVRGSNHCGAMDWYTLMAAAQNMAGIAGTNAIPTMAPWGGAEKIVGINPLSIALPAGRGKPFVLDFAFGATAHGKMRVYAQKGTPIPEGWAFDRDGHPTTDAVAALVGLIQPIGQHKGVGLGMAVGMLSSLLSGAAYGTDSGTMETGAVVGVDGHFFLAVDIAFFEDVDRFKERVDAVVAQVHGSRRREGVDRLYVPGEIEAELEDASRNGINLPGATLDDILREAERLGVDARALAAG